MDWNKETQRKCISVAFSSKGIKQKELAKEMGVSQSTITRWKSGDSFLDMPTIVKLAKKIGMTLTEMIAVVDEV